jgi:hypothetical protein
VQFKLDGANLGVEDTAAPYAVNWDTTSATNGTHQLTAVARDGAGNTTTSAAITVTVANDTVAPTVTALNPAAGQTRVNPRTNVNVTFSEAMDPTTINIDTIQLRNATTNALVSATVSYDATAQRATLNPRVRSLNARTTYIVTVRGGTSDPRVKDLAGNAMTADIVWSFTTR